MEKVNQDAKGIERLGDALRNACYKNGAKRNEIDLDVDFLLGHETLAEHSFYDFKDFMSLVRYGAFDVKRFTKRELTEEEQTKSGKNYRNGEENILRPFSELSYSSQKENLSAAIGAVKVYEELSKAGISIDEMQKNPEIKHMIGVGIHADWLNRNKEHSDKSLKVPYDQLDDWTQQQDLTVFYALLDVIKKNNEKYLVSPEDGYELPDYNALENEVLGLNNGIKF